VGGGPPRDPPAPTHAAPAAGDRQRPLRQALGSAFLAAFVVLFLAPFHWWMSADPWMPGTLILGFFDLAFLVLGLVRLYRLGRLLKYGTGWIRFDRFPFFLGETLDLRLGCRGRLDRFRSLIVTLRLVQVTRETRGSSISFVGHQHWAERLEFDPRTLQDPTELPVSIPLPADGPCTSIAEDPPRYWEIEIEGPAAGPGLDFQARFLVPVYSRTGGPGA
jgi:hypothetical protein